MSRTGGDAIIIRPSNNVYTALLAIAVVLQVVAFICVFIQYNALFGKKLFGE